MDKEQIIIDGEKYNACNGCKLWDGYICTGDRSYEPNAEAHRAICNEHMAHEFWKVYHELFYKTQECEELKRKVELMMDCPDCKVDTYKKALDEIEEYIYTDCEYNNGCDRNICIRCKYSNVHDKRILDITSKAKGCI